MFRYYFRKEGYFGKHFLVKPDGVDASYENGADRKLVKYFGSTASFNENTCQMVLKKSGILSIVLW